MWTMDVMQLLFYDEEINVDFPSSVFVKAISRLNAYSFHSFLLIIHYRSFPVDYLTICSALFVCILLDLSEISCLFNLLTLSTVPLFAHRVLSISFNAKN